METREGSVAGFQGAPWPDSESAWNFQGRHSLTFLGVRWPLVTGPVNCGESFRIISPMLDSTNYRRNLLGEKGPIEDIDTLIIY